MAFRTLKDGWDPVRRGAIYCSPRCGCGCTYKAFVAATEAAQKCAERMGDAWHPVVWENFGWHWKIELRARSAETVEIRGRGRRDFTAEIHAGYLNGPHEGAARWGVQFWGEGKTPEAAIARAITNASAAQRMIEKAASLAHRESRKQGDRS